MTDQKNPAPPRPVESRPVEAASAAPGERRSVVRPPLAKASESGDPAVQKLLADRWAAQQYAAGYQDGVDQGEALRAAHEEHVARIDAELAGLGFE